jgi:hypothetical protein
VIAHHVEEHSMYSELYMCDFLTGDDMDHADGRMLVVIRRCKDGFVSVRALRNAKKPQKSLKRIFNDPSLRSERRCL